MTARARIATIVTFVVVLFGIGAGIEANAALADTTTPPSSTNGCVVVPSLELAVCLGRF